jgi:hypothetical protein
MPKAIAFTMLIPVVLVSVLCTAISFRFMPSGIGELDRSSALIGTLGRRRALALSLLDISLPIGCLKEGSSRTIA